MASELDLEVTRELTAITEAMRATAMSLDAQMKANQKMVQIVSEESDRNRRTAADIARKNAEVKSRNKMSGSDKAWLYGILGTMLICASTVGLIVHNVREGDSEKSRIIQTCMDQGGQWRSMGGQDDANKYDEVCIRSGK